MKRFFLYIIILCGLLLMAGCHDRIVIPEEPEPQPAVEAERTVIVYIAGDNSLSRQIKQDTTEMATAKYQIPENVNFFIYIDDVANTPGIYQLSKEKGMQLWKKFDEELCSTDSLTMLKALQDIVHHFPAHHYGITFWSHATGWTPRRKTFGQDYHSGETQGESEMEIPVLRDVLAQLPKFDYIFFDACFMQCIEVAYELREVTNFIVGSPAEIPGPGAPYDKIIEALCNGDAKGIVQGYDSSYPCTYEGFKYPGVLLSCIDCTQLDALAEATGHFLIPLFLGHTDLNPFLWNFQPYCDAETSIGTFTYCFDMRTTMCRLLSEEDYATWMTTFDSAVPLHTLSSTKAWFAEQCRSFDGVVEVKDSTCYGGVSMFVPMAKYEAYGLNDDFQKTSWYKATGWDVTGW